MLRSSRLGLTVALLVIAMAALRLCHVHLLWADEDYHLTAAINILHGRAPYRDFWYDKPPLSALYYLLIGGYWGWPLRLLDTTYVLAACYLAFRTARVWWSEREGLIAAFLLAFFLTFYLPSTVISFAADALMIVPHLAAIYCAFRKRPFWAGVWCGVAFLVNVKAVFILAVCACWLIGELPLLAIGFAVPLTGGLVWAAGWGSWAGYCEQVWRWGLLYTKGSPVANPWETGVARTLDWLGFHAALAAGTAFAFLRCSRETRSKAGVWLAFSFAAVCLGTRFAPHYFLQLAPAMAVIAARGIVLGWRERPGVAAVLMLLLLSIPLIRFGPRYLMLAADNLRDRPPRWSDVVLDLDSQSAAQQIKSLSRPGDTLFVWGYRPDMYVYTRMVSDSLFEDSQPLTGVPADRHLHVNSAIYGGPAARNRQLLVRSRPTFLVDGLGLLNPSLRPEVYPEIQLWLSQYKLVGRTKLSLIYRRID